LKKIMNLSMNIMRTVKKKIANKIIMMKIIKMKIKMQNITELTLKS